MSGWVNFGAVVLFILPF